MTQVALPDAAPAATAPGTPSPPATPDQIRLQLKRLAESPFFRTSKRCRLFLEHVVEHSLSESPQPLKERTLGVHVFAREPTYDTASRSDRPRHGRRSTPAAGAVLCRRSASPGLADRSAARQLRAADLLASYRIRLPVEERKADAVPPRGAGRAKRWWASPHSRAGVALVLDYTRHCKTAAPCRDGVRSGSGRRCSIRRRRCCCAQAVSICTSCPRM